MGWSIGFDTNWNRDIGYGVPAYCDHPDCGAEINRGLSYVCGGEAYGGDRGCGLYFCTAHLEFVYDEYDCTHPVCCCCATAFLDPFTPKPDHPDWIRHKLTDESWEQWRQENQVEAAALKKSLSA